MNEDRERRDQLAKKFLEKKREKATIWPTLKQMHELNALAHDPLKNDFVSEISEIMDNKKNKYITTYEIVSFEKLQVERSEAVKGLGCWRGNKITMAVF